MTKKSKTRGNGAPKVGRPKKYSLAAKRSANMRATDLRSIRAGSVYQRLVGEVRFVRAWIDAENLAQEPLLESMAWVENRYMTPLERTEQFTRDYAAKYRRARARAGLPAGKPIADDFALNAPDEMNALWRARAEADLLGVPYDLYLDVVIDGHIKHDKWKRPPRPNQLYGKLAGPRLQGRPTQAEASARLASIAINPDFGADAYRGDPVQEAALQIIQADVEAAPSPASRLAVYLVDWRMITGQRALDLFGSDLVDAAIAARGQPIAPTSISSQPYRPACLGYYNPGPQTPCHACPFQVECDDVAIAARDELVRLTGTDNPRLAHKRRIDRERKRRQRQREKAKGDGRPG